MISNLKDPQPFLFSILRAEDGKRSKISETKTIVDVRCVAEFGSSCCFVITHYRQQELILEVCLEVFDLQQLPFL